MDFADALLMVKAGHPELAGWWGKLLGGGSSNDDGGSKPFDELTWDQVAASTKTGKYKTFALGAKKEMDLGAEGVVQMQIVGIDTDDLADESGKAALSIMCYHLLATGVEMNPELSPSSAPYTAGTGTIGGYEMCAMRNYLYGTILPLISKSVRNNIKPVKKQSVGFDTAGGKTRTMSAETIWLASAREVFGGSSYESFGPVYSQVFNGQGPRKKTKSSEDKIISWWLRTANDPTAFAFVNAAGTYYTSVPNRGRGVAFGFCL